MIVVDLMLPGIDGLEVCRMLRAESTTSRIPIIMLTAKASESDRIVGLEIGADDYVSKPFSVRELMLRIDARLRSRRAAAESPLSSAPPMGEAPGRSFRLRNLRVDEPAHRVFVDDTEIHVSALEMRLLVYLFHSPGRMRTRRELLTEVWGLSKEHLWVTCFQDEKGEIPRDDEAADIWRQQPGLIKEFQNYERISSIANTIGESKWIHDRRDYSCRSGCDLFAAKFRCFIH